MRFRFSIRDLLLITVIVGLATGWWLDHRRLTAPPPVKPPRVLATAPRYNPPVPPTFTAPQASVQDYDGGLLYDQRSKGTPVVAK